MIPFSAQAFSQKTKIGGIVAGAAFLCILATILIVCVHRRKTKNRTIQTNKPKISITSNNPNPYYDGTDDINVHEDRVIPLSIRSTSENHYYNDENEIKPTDNTGNIKTSIDT